MVEGCLFSTDPEKKLNNDETNKALENKRATLKASLGHGTLNILVRHLVLDPLNLCHGIHEAPVVSSLASVRLSEQMMIGAEGQNGRRLWWPDRGDRQVRVGIQSGVPFAKEETHVLF